MAGLRRRRKVARGVALLDRGHVARLAAAQHVTSSSTTAMNSRTAPTTKLICGIQIGIGIRPFAMSLNSQLS